MLKSVVCWLSFKCNFRCPYCTEYQLATQYHDAPADAWIKAFKRYHNLIIDFTGGEPFLYPEIHKLTEALRRQGHRVAVTTNMSKVDFSLFPMFSHITMSYHPSQPASYNFWEQCAKAKTFTKYLSVNFVANVSQLKYLPEAKKKARDLDIKLHVERDTGHIYSTLEWYMIKDDVSPDRVHIFKEDVLCSSGNTYLQVLPDGSARPCFNRPFDRSFFRGDIRESELYRCPAGIATNCGGCDYDGNTLRSLDGTILKVGK